MKLEIKNISKKFKKISILKNVNLTLESGNIYGFIGRNGSGKSVLLKIISGLYTPTTGKIMLDSEDIFSKLSFLPNTRVLIEKPSFIDDLTGYENLKLLADIQKLIGEEEILKALKDVNLYEEKDKKFKNYSLGMKQKLGIAQVIMENTDIMIFDEPFNGIEFETAAKLRKLFLKKKKEGKLIIVASHIKEDIDVLSDVIYEFENGEVKKYEKR